MTAPCTFPKIHLGLFGRKQMFGFHFMQSRWRFSMKVKTGQTITTQNNSAIRKQHGPTTITTITTMKATNCQMAEKQWADEYQIPFTESTGRCSNNKNCHKLFEPCKVQRFQLCVCSSLFRFFSILGVIFLRSLALAEAFWLLGFKLYFISTILYLCRFFLIFLLLLLLFSWNRADNISSSMPRYGHGKCRYICVSVCCVCVWLHTLNLNNLLSLHSVGVAIIQL